MNNFFPALEGVNVTNEEAIGYTIPSKNPNYYKQDEWNSSNNPNMVMQDQIDEVPQEQEEAESQENIHHGPPGLPNFYPAPTMGRSRLRMVRLWTKMRLILNSHKMMLKMKVDSQEAMSYQMNS